MRYPASHPVAAQVLPRGVKYMYAEGAGHGPLTAAYYRPSAGVRKSLFAHRYFRVNLGGERV